VKTFEFWIAVAVAVLVKIRTSRSLGWWQTLTTIAVAVGAAYVGTDWAQARTGLPEPVAAALVALSAEGVMRWLLIALDDPKKAIDLWRDWRR
jgi:hypothetical protein